MSFKLTYATMFNPPEELHTRFDAAMARVRARLGRYQPLYVGGEERRTRQMLTKRNPADHSEVLGEFAAASAADAEAALARRARRLVRLEAHRRRAARRAAARRRPDHRGARVRHRCRPDTRSRQEPHGGARRGAGGGRFLLHLLRRLRARPGLRSGAAERSARRPRVAQSQRAEALRRVGGHHAVQFPDRTRRRPGGRGAHHRQHRGAQGCDRHAVGGTPARRLHPRCRPAARGVQLPERPERRGRQHAGRSSAHRRRHLHRLLRSGTADRAQAAGWPLSASVHRRDGRQERLHRQRRGRSRARRGR